MNLLKKFFERFGHLFLELIVIFISVLLAFVVENYREAWNEEQTYIKDLATFRAEVVEEIEIIHSKLDSFRLPGDGNNRGEQFSALLNLTWLNSRIDSGRATLADYGFIIDRYFSLPLLASTDEIALAEQLQTNFSEQFRSRATLRWITIYREEIQTLKEIDRHLGETHAQVRDLIHLTSPYMKFNKKDSMIFVSNEFLWSYKELLEMARQRYEYVRYLAQRRFVNVITTIDNELSVLGADPTDDADCYSTDFLKRYACGSGNEAKSGDLSSVEELTVKDREDYLRSHRR